MQILCKHGWNVGEKCWLFVQSESPGISYFLLIIDGLLVKNKQSDFSPTINLDFLLNLQIPVHAAEHYYLHTKPVENITPNTPVLHDPDSNVYFRENEGRFLAGGFEPEAKVRYQI